MSNSAIIITGANKGIGFECVQQFCRNYPKQQIIAVSRNIDNLLQLSSNYTNLHSIPCDVINFDLLKKELELIAGKYHIEGLITCAGTAAIDDFCSIAYESHKQILDVNVLGLTNTLEIVLPHMRKYKKGTIINISSLADRYPRPRSAVYGASKSYVKSISDSLRLSESKHNIRICNLSPALIDTPLSRSVRKTDSTKIGVADFVNVISFIYSQPQHICIRDLVIAPTDYEG